MREQFDVHWRKSSYRPLRHRNWRRAEERSLLRPRRHVCQQRFERRCNPRWTC